MARINAWIAGVLGLALAGAALVFASSVLDGAGVRLAVFVLGFASMAAAAAIANLGALLAKRDRAERRGQQYFVAVIVFWLMAAVGVVFLTAFPGTGAVYVGVAFLAVLVALTALVWGDVIMPGLGRRARGRGES